jgi:hypothetical protein
MRVLFFGNTNNHFAEFIMYLASEGHLISLVLIQQGELHDPAVKGKKYLKNKRIEFIDLRNHGEEELIINPSIIMESISTDFDLAFLEDMGPRFSPYLKCPTISIVIGFNLTKYASKNFAKERSFSWKPEFKKSDFAQHLLAKYEQFSLEQASGFAQSTRIMSVPLEIAPSSEKILLNEMIDTGKKLLTPIVSNLEIKNKLEFRRFFSFNKSSFKIFFAARLDNIALHQDGSERNDKGYEYMFEVIRFYSNQPNFKFYFFNKGFGAESFFKKLEQSNLSHNLRVLPSLSYRSYLRVLSTADVVIDSLGKSPIGRVTTDAIQLGKPVLANINFQTFKMMFPLVDVSINPIFESSNSEMVIAHLAKIYDSRFNSIVYFQNLAHTFTHGISHKKQFKNILENLGLDPGSD